jgi:DNA polymerase III sliding clamp (beta) subunit (PCNA family)
MVTLVILLSVFTVFGNQISKIVAIMKESDEFDVQYSLRDHAIVFSANSIDLVCSFLVDYYKNNPHTKVLVIGEREMGQTMKSVLDLSYVEGKLYFLSMGKGFDRKTIKKS